ncbi:pyrroline-5-carboxylate reductase [Lentibacillus sp. CBA3610]|uniref:pyrroline-5-carboxylate reductase n=1 Tax=Lentibacillus sp. CBA3610 TaxID=2518176 RepID=UPI0015951492|nr:pyrroline-5-carboxylate reductase [Lentibacillus sp. CBA3610]QKY70850.1 pyrroline-5-carboxylate reductase [Lentibacillus sp. CBA3610]
MREKMAFIGAGSMAESILTGILNSGFLPKEQIYVTNKSDKERLTFLKKQYAVQNIDNKEKAVDGANIIVIAVKPYDLEAAVASIRDHLTADQLLISVAAGVSTDTISQLIGKAMPVIRAMPNTSSAAGQSATAVTRGEFATDEHLQTAMDLFNTIGTATEVDEADMHTVTAISGSGPAYVYYLVEAMESAAVEAGLDQDTAHNLITQTIVGAGEMLKTSGLNPNKLRENITSPGGTTQAGLEMLSSHNFQEAVVTCVERARERSIELGKKL